MLADDARIGAGIDQVIERLFADGVSGPDVAAKDFTVAQTTLSVLVVDTNDLFYPMRIATADDLGTVLLHDPENNRDYFTAKIHTLNGICTIWTPETTSPVK
nr:MAG TPA: hypothetical protein [Caudoviricetes sp.]